MSTVRATKQGFTYHSMADACMEEIAAAVNLSGRRGSGIAFACKANIAHGGKEKESARGRLLSLLTWEAWPDKVRMLTMPGLKWRFERIVIGRYTKQPITPEEKILHLADSRQLREFHCIESDPAVYRASLKWMPGFNGEGFRIDTPTRVSTQNIASYDFADFEKYVADKNCPVFDFAWIDFSGFLTPGRVSALQLLWETRLTSTLAVTFMNARYGATVKKNVLRYGSAANWLSNVFQAEIFDLYEYADPVAMIQVVFRKSSDRAALSLATQKGEM